MGGEGLGNFPFFEAMDRVLLKKYKSTAPGLFCPFTMLGSHNHADTGADHDFMAEHAMGSIEGRQDLLRQLFSLNSVLYTALYDGKLVAAQPCDEVMLANSRLQFFGD